jgi:flagellar basal-body rod protein FlgG
MLALMTKQDVIANNLANANTTGFKRDYASITSFPEALIYAQDQQLGAKYTQAPVGMLSSGVGLGRTGFINTDGVLRQTGGKLDLALSGDGLFAIQTPAGEMYTRNGNLTKDSFGRIADQDGHLILGEKGPIRITGNEVFVNEAGKVYVDGAYVDTLKIRQFSQGELEKVGSNTFAASSQGTRASAIVRQGYLEGSNVDATSEMVDMMVVARSYEANQRVLKTQDEMLGKAVNDVGRIS